MIDTGSFPLFANPGVKLNKCFLPESFFEIKEKSSAVVFQVRFRRFNSIAEVLDTESKENVVVIKSNFMGRKYKIYDSSGAPIAEYKVGRVDSLIDSKAKRVLEINRKFYITEVVFEGNPVAVISFMPQVSGWGYSMELPPDKKNYDGDLRLLIAVFVLNFWQPFSS